MVAVKGLVCCLFDEGSVLSCYSLIRYDGTDQLSQYSDRARLNGRWNAGSECCLSECEA